MLALVLLSARAAQLIGHWPHALSDDPSQIGLQDGVYQWMYTGVNLLLTGFWVALGIGFPLSIATVGLGQRQPQTRRRWVWASWSEIAVYGLGVLLVWWEPTHRLGWFFRLDLG